MSTQTVTQVVTKTAVKTAAKTAAIVGSEAALIESGIGIPIAFLEAAIIGLFKLGKFIKQKKEAKRDREADEKAQAEKAQADRELQQQADESARIQLQKEQAEAQQKIIDDETLSKKEKADAQKKLDDEKAAEQKKLDDEAKKKLSDEEKAKQDEIERQRQLDIKHQQEDEQLENEQQQQAASIQNRNIQIQDQLAYERQQRLTPGEIPSSLVPAASNSGRYDEYGRPIREGGNFQPQQPYRPIPMPDGPGGGNDPSGNGGGNDDPDPNGNNDDPNRNEELVYPPGYGPQNRNPSQSNPYADVLWQLAKQINDNKNREEKAVLDKKQEEESKAPAPNLQPTNPEGEKPIDPNIDPSQKPLGSDPNTWSPTGKKNVPEDPSQLVKPAYSEAHLVENQLLAILNAQGLGELTSEDSLRQLTKIEADMPKPVKIDSNSVYSSVLAPF